jgi:hypothetical protein
MNRKGFLQIPFQWVFAIIVGIFILFLAIYFSVKMLGSGSFEVDTATARQIEVLMNPLETSFESGKTTTMILPSETRIYNKCDNTGNFGKQKIQVSQKSFNKWSEPGSDISSRNKYIFSDEIVEGEKFYLFSVPFEYGFKIANLIILTSKEYCFLDAPNEIESEINQENVEFEDYEEDCSIDSIKVCFMGGDCDVKVNIGQDNVEKEGEELYFTGNLIYSAIFSDKEVYECQVKRLMQRTEQLASLYWDKASFMSKRGCNSDLTTDLLVLKNSVKDVESSKDLDSVDIIVEQINGKKDFEECEVF